MPLNLGSLQIPLNAATKTFAILAKRGAGKSYTAAVLAEEFFKHHIPFVVFDPIDVWWGLRLAQDGKQQGLPVVVFGTEHADIPLARP
jgi:DNA helicase HerA-like ATPase